MVDFPLGLDRLVQSQLDVAGGRVDEAQEVPRGLLEVLILLRLAEETPIQTFLHVELHHRPREAETHELGVHDCRLNSHYSVEPGSFTRGVLWDLRSPLRSWLCSSDENPRS